MAGFELHDVWRVDLEGGVDCTVQALRQLISRDGRAVGPVVRGLFWLRFFLGRLFRLDERSREKPRTLLTATVPEELARSSLVTPGTPDGAFTQLHMLPHEAAYEALNATVHAVLALALTPTATGHRFYWATYIKPIGRITAIYIGLIDPFRRGLVYPGLESWLQRSWRGSIGDGCAR